MHQNELNSPKNFKIFDYFATSITVPSHFCNSSSLWFLSVLAFTFTLWKRLQVDHAAIWLPGPWSTSEQFPLPVDLNDWQHGAIAYTQKRDSIVPCPSHIHKEAPCKFTMCTFVKTQFPVSNMTRTSIFPLQRVTWHCTARVLSLQQCAHSSCCGIFCAVFFSSGSLTPLAWKGQSQAPFAKWDQFTLLSEKPNHPLEA